MAGSMFGIRTPYKPAGYGGYANNQTGSYANSAKNFGGNLFNGGGYGNAAASNRVTVNETLNRFSGGGYNSTGTARGTALQTLRGSGGGAYRSISNAPISNFDRIKVADSFTTGNGSSFLLPTLRKTIGR